MSYEIQCDHEISFRTNIIYLRVLSESSNNPIKMNEIL